LAETLGAGAGDIEESLDADKKRIREMQRERSALANATRKEQMDAVAMGFDLTGKVAQLDQGIQAQKADLAIKREELQMRQNEFDLRRDEAKAAVEAAGLKFDLDKYLVTEINAGGERAKNAQAFMVARYGDKGSDAGPFTEKLKDQTGAKQNPAFKY
jgi:peptidoglycan hydrolase CwlO-like protein